MIESVPQLWLETPYPPVLSEILLNTGADPDCGDYGGTSDFEIPAF